MKLLTLVLLVAACDEVFSVPYRPPPIDAPGDDVSPVDGNGIDTAPTPDAFTCATNAACFQVNPNSCCINPGPAGQCVPGVVISGTCEPG